MSLNFTAQDTFRMLFAILLFPTVAIFPGYVIGWLFDIFSFKHRTLLARYVIALALSNAFIPIILFLAFRLVSNNFGIGIILAFFIAWAAIQIKFRENHRLAAQETQGIKLALVIASTWIVFCIFLLVDLQIGQRLYFNAAAYDFTTRTALIEAITRTGIPPVNPAYYPGHFEKITELYYFWYILGSVIDTLGGNWVDARIALFAGITWSGLALIATIATYLRIRNPQPGITAWRASSLGAQLLAVSGLDFVPVVAFMIAIKTTFGNLPFDGRIEGWNLPIMSWLNALTWVPNHVTAMAACMVAMLAILSSDHRTKLRSAVYVTLAGAAIGSSFGLSTWITFTFGVFMAVWAISLFFQKRGRMLVPAIIAAGILGVAFAAPFLLEILRSGGKSEVTGALPIGLYVRHFAYSKALPPGIREVAGVFLLPLNYFFELGFFFVIAVLWIRQQRKSETRQNPYYQAEMLLVATVTVLLSFVKSTVIAINDLGMRGWLLAQFVLIVWAVDLLGTSLKVPSRLTLTSTNTISASRRVKDLLGVLLIVGMLTTALEASSTRFWTILVDAGITGVPNELSPDRNLGERTYDARLAYEFIRDQTPQTVVIQNNPTVLLDRPSGLYGTRQMVIADRTAYGVPVNVLKDMSTSVGRIFLAEGVTDWTSIDAICDQHAIQAIVVNDTDPLWSSLDTLQETRPPLYLKRRYAVYDCGSRK